MSSDIPSGDNELQGSPFCCFAAEGGRKRGKMAMTWDQYPEINKIEIGQALDFCCRQILHILPEFTDKFQQAYSVDGF